MRQNPKVHFGRDQLKYIVFTVTNVKPLAQQLHSEFSEWKATKQEWAKKKEFKKTTNETRTFCTLWIIFRIYISVISANADVANVDE